MAVGCFDGLVEIGEDVADVFDADAEANEFGSDAGGGLLRGLELLVGGGGGMNHQRFSIADVGDEGEELE